MDPAGLFSLMFFLDAIAIPDDPVPVIWRMPCVLASMEISNNCWNRTMDIVANSPLESYVRAILTSSSSIVGLCIFRRLIV
jgi:hypothetical protein